MKLHIILRTCQRNDSDKKTNLKRICGDDRETMVLKCVMSLVNTINACVVSNNIKFTILDDHSDDSFLVKLNKILNTCNKEIDLINFTLTGFQETAAEQFRLASKSDADMVYTIEDDYLHEEHALDYMLFAHNHLTQKYRREIVLFPYDCIFRYVPNREYSTVLLYDGTRYWRQIKHTANTIFARKEFFSENIDMFLEYSYKYPNCTEDDYINKLYEDHSTGLGYAKAFSPIPSVAYHLSWNEPATIRTDHLSWRDLWDKIKL